MVSTNNGTKARAGTVGTSSTTKQTVRAILKEYLKNNFASTLGQEKDIENICMALMYRESSFNTSAHGPAYGASHLRTILTYPAVSNVYAQGSADQRRNIVSSASAYGLGQVTGYYCIKGCGATGKCEMERLRPDITGNIVVPPGVDVATTMLGDANISNQILAHLVVLEGKYKEIAPRLVAKGTYSNKITAAVAAYLGLGGSDSLGTTPQAYATSIIYGSAYKMANGGTGSDGSPLLAGAGAATTNPVSNQSANGPTISAASGQNLSVAGC